MPQRIIITAGGNGIGRAIAENFYQTGAIIHVCDTDDNALNRLQDNCPAIKTTCLDVSDEDSLNQWLDGTINDLGGIDVLINNAGIAGPVCMVEELDLDDWRKCFAVNLDAQMLTCRRIVPVMKDQKNGAIINIASTSGLYGVPARAAYAASKWGVVGFTKSLAIEVGAWGITVNAICPGSVAGPRIERIIAAEAEATNRSITDIRNGYVKDVSMRRLVKPDEIAALCQFLASPAAAMISGQAIPIDGNTETYHAE